MAIKCADCGATPTTGRIFFQCSACGRWFCSQHGYKGKKCVCGRGFLKR